MIDMRQVTLALTERRLAEQRAALEDRLLALAQRRDVNVVHLEALLAEFRALEAQAAVHAAERAVLCDRRASSGGRRLGDTTER
jgi:hypothetical protein